MRKTTRPTEVAAALVRAAQQGDTRATEELLGRYTNLARAVAMRAGCRPSDLDDVLQDVAVQTLVWLPTLRNPQAFTNWFGQVVVFVTRAHQRREQRRRRLAPASQHDLGAVTGFLRDGRTPEAIAEARELSNALEVLPLKVRLAVRMRHLEGLELDEIAARMGSSRATVKRHLVAAESCLRGAVDRDLSRMGEPPLQRRRRGRLGIAALAAMLYIPRRARAALQWLGAALIGRARFLAPVSIAGLMVVGGGFLGRSREAASATAATMATTATASPRTPWRLQPLPAVPDEAAAETIPGLEVWTATASAADAFVESIGLNIRLGEDRQPLALVGARLAEIGVRHVIDVQGTRLDWLASLEPLGIRSNLFIETDADAHAAVVGRSYVEAITLKHHRTGVPLDQWTEAQRRWMEETRLRLARDPATRHIAIVGATIADEAKRHALGDVGAFVDFAGIGAPSRRLPPGGAFLDGILAVHRPVYDGRPVVIPQVTYATGSCADCLSETVQANYVVRTFFEHHRRGIIRTYGTHLFDRTPDPARYEEGMGLVRCDGQKKPSFDALARVIRMFSDRGPASPAAVMRIEASDPPPHIEHALFQRRDGTLLLALWLAVGSGAEKLTAVARLRLPPELRAVAHHRPSGDPLPIPEEDTERFLAVPVSDEVSVLELR